MIRAGASLVTAFALFLGGCGQIAPGAGFSGVERLAFERTGKHVRWDQGTPDDEAARKLVERMLSGEMSVEDSVQVALLNNRGLQATFGRIGVAQADLVQAGLLRNPLLNVETRFSSIGSGFHLDLVGDLLSVFLVPLKKRLAESAFEASKLEVAGEVLRVASETKKAFYEVQASEQALELRRTVAETTAASYDLSRRLHEAGNITSLDMSNERALYEQAKLDLAEAESLVLTNREQLNMMMGAWGHGTGWTLAPRLPELPAEDLPMEDVEKRAISSSLDLAAVKQRILTDAAALGLARPGLLLQDGSFGPNAEKEPGGGWGVGPEFSIPLPLFDQGQAALALAWATLRKNREEYAALAVEIRSRTRTARNRMLVARNRAHHYRTTIIPLRERIVEETQVQYNGMLVGAFQLLTSKEQEINAGGRYIESLRDYWVARTELEEILGGKLPGPEMAAVTRASPGEGRSARQEGES